MKHFLLHLIIAGNLAFSSMVQANSDSSLVACYPFTGNANDYSGNKFNGVVTGATLTSDRFGNPNSAYHFNGSTDNITISDFNTLISSNELSVSIWAKADESTSNCAFMLSPDDDGDRMLGAIQYEGNIYWDYGDIDNNGRSTVGITFDSNWDHYVFIVSQSRNIKQVYRNDTLIINTKYGGSLINRDRTLLIGGDLLANGVYNGFHGSLDDLKIYNYPVSPSIVSQLYKGLSCLVDSVSVSASVANICPGDSVQFQGLYLGKAKNWKWTFPNGIPSSSFVQNPVITYANPGNYNLKLVVTDSSGTGSDSVSYSDFISILTPPAPVMTSNDTGHTFCSGSFSLISNFSHNNQWYLNGLALPDDTSQSIHPSKSGFYSLSVTPKQGCPGFSGIFSATLIASPVAAISASDSIICAGSPVTLIGLGSGTYSWSTTETSDSVIVSPLLSSPYTLTVTGKNGCSSVAVQIISVNALPETPRLTNLDTDSIFCLGIGSLESNLNVKNQWYLNGSPLPGDTNQLLFPVNSGFYSVGTTTDLGCSAVSGLVSLNVLPSPSSAVIFSSADTLCAGSPDTLIAFGNGMFHWSTADTAGTIIVNPVILTTYTLTVTSANGCAVTSTTSIQVNPVPSAPSIFQNGNELASSANTGNQWNLNGSPLPGQTSEFYQPTENAFYSVTLSGSDGCSVTSNIINFSFSGIKTYSEENTWKIYPNPSDGKFSVDLNSYSNDVLILTVSNTLGQVVYSNTVQPSNGLFTIDLSGLAGNGVYTLMLQNSSDRMVQRVIVSK